MSLLLLLETSSVEQVDVCSTGDTFPITTATGSFTRTVTVNHPGGRPILFVVLGSNTFTINAATFDSAAATVLAGPSSRAAHLLIGPETAAGSKSWVLTISSTSSTLSAMAAAVKDSASVVSYGFSSEAGGSGDKRVWAHIPKFGAAAVFLWQGASDGQTNFQRPPYQIFVSQSAGWKVAKKLDTGVLGFDVLGTGGSTGGTTGYIIFSSTYSPGTKGEAVFKFDANDQVADVSGPVTSASITPNAAVTAAVTITGHFRGESVLAVIPPASTTTPALAVTNNSYIDVLVNGTGVLRTVEISLSKTSATTRGIIIRSSADGYVEDLLTVANISNNSLRPWFSNYVMRANLPLTSGSLTLRIYFFAPTGSPVEIGEMSFFVEDGVTVTPAHFFQSDERGRMWDLTDLANLKQNIDGTVDVTTAGDPVGWVRDLSPNRDPWVATANDTTRPTYQVDSDGKPYLDFDGSNDKLVAGPMIAATDGRHTTVLGTYGPAQTSSTKALIGSYSSSSAIPYMNDLLATTAGDATKNMRNDASSGPGTAPSLAGMFDGATKRVLSTQYNGSNSFWRLRNAPDRPSDGLSGNWTSVTQGSFTNTFTLDRSVLGANGSAGFANFFSGRIYSGFSINRVLTSTELKLGEEWVSSRTRTTTLPGEGGGATRKIYGYAFILQAA